MWPQKIDNYLNQQTMQFLDYTQDYKDVCLNVKTRWYGCSLGLKYQLNPIILKLPRLKVVHIGFNELKTPEYLTVSFEDDDIDPEIKKCLLWLKKFEEHLAKIATTLGCLFKHRLLAKNDIYYMNLSLKEAEIFDQENKLLTNFDNFQIHKINNLRALVEIPILWRSTTQHLHYKLSVHQIRFLPKIWKHNVSLLEECQKVLLQVDNSRTVPLSLSGSKIPPPPPPPPRPPPPPPPPPPKRKVAPYGGVMLPFLKDIRDGTFQLKTASDTSGEPRLKSDDKEFKIDLKTLLETKGKLRATGTITKAIGPP